MAPQGSMIAMLLLSSLAVSTSAFNITNVLEPYPNFSQLRQWFIRTGVADEINNRTSLTILAPSDDVLQGYISGVPNAWTDPDKVADTLRYHVLLQYFSIPELQEQVRKNGTSVTTLLQTTGRANETQGFVTLYNNGSSFLVGHEFADAFGNETVIGNVTQVPYEYSVLQVSSVLTPVPPSPPAPASAPSPTVLKAPIPSPKPTTTSTGSSAASSPAESTTTNHASIKTISKPVTLIGIMLAFIVLLL